MGQQSIAGRRVGFVGSGQMARALAKGFVDAGLVVAEQLIAADALPQALQSFVAALPGSRTTDDNRLAAAESDILFLATKPQHMPTALAQIDTAASGCLIISIAAGVPLATICRGLGTERVVRVMPNTPCLIGKGASAFACASGVGGDDIELVTALLSSVGLVLELPESLLDAVTGLSGSGPAFVYEFIGALSDAGVREGLPRDVALRLSAQTVFGAAEMVLQSGEHPAILKDRVTSPGGTTIAGLAALAERGFTGTVMAAVRAATERSKALSDPPCEKNAQ